MTTRAKDPLAPLETGVQVVLALVGTFFVLMLGSAVLGGTPGIGGTDATEVCVTTPPGHGIGYGGSGATGDGPIGLREGVRWFPREIDICDTDPSTATLALGLSQAVLGPVGATAGLLLLWFVVRRARREGVFSRSIPGALRALATYLLAWAAVGWLWRGIVDAVLLRRMAEDTSGFVFSSPDVPVVTVLVGLGLVTLARVMAQAVALREDSEGTV